MKKVLKTLLLTPMVLVASAGLTSCNKASNLTLRILNSEDYIYLRDKSVPGDKDLVDQFIDYVEANYPQYKGLSVVYDTSDTNETIYSEIQTGKSNYDLINVSEYMAQKIVNGGFANKIDRSLVPNYDAFASKEIKGRLDAIETTIKVYDENQHKYVDEPVKLEDYAVGYMWGTLGILFNPNYSGFSGIDKNEIITDMMDYDSLWNPKYKNTISIKNSMRDTYAIGVLETYRDQFQAMLDNLDPDDPDSLEAYQTAFATLFNSSDEKSVAEVQVVLEELKKNVFGLEVDSGKEDIVSGKIGINIAWSGDATYSMEKADAAGMEEGLFYSIPKLGSNIWSDVWIMPNCARSDEQYELAHLFLDYLCDPSIATKNMSYTGYTSFIGGDDILELARDWYDIRTDEIYQEVEDEESGEAEYYQIYALDQSSLDQEEWDYSVIGYDDFLKDKHLAAKDNQKLYYFEPYEEESGEETVVIEEPKSYDDLIEHGDYVYLTDDEGEFVYELDGNDEPLLDENNEPIKVIKTYGDLTIVDADDSELEEVDLSYFFNGTFYQTAQDKYGDDLANMDPSEVVLYHDNVDTLFYTDSYLPYTYLDENNVEQQNICVGHAFFCQYPDKNTINRCAVMEDYGANNANVMKMWENFKSDPLPLWAIIVLIIFIAGILALIAYFVIQNVLIKKVRKARVAE